ncbi:rod shape-determining protein [Candidatus Dojkabacteria bacterium]|nr:rod shape-determining protein [Candidatus Dojkabacteria bacterium]
MRILDKILDKYTYDIGIDLGTVNTLVVLKNHGIVINEPSVVAINQKSGEIVAVGNEARHMIGRTPGYIKAIEPLVDGIINDFDSTEAMLRYFIKKVHKEYSKFFNIPRPRIVIGIPSKITEVEMRAVIDSAKSAGARNVYIIEEAMAAAIGSKLPIQDAYGSMVIDIGGGTTDLAIISLGGIVVSNSIKIAGNKFDDSIVRFVKSKYNMLIGDKMAEEIKIKIGGAIPRKKKEEVELKGRDLLTGFPKKILINNVEVLEAMVSYLGRIADAAKDLVDKVPEEVIYDLLDNGIHLTGGGALIYGIDEFMEDRLKIPVTVVENPLESVAKGTEFLLEEMDLLEKVKANNDDLI